MALHMMRFSSLTVMAFLAVEGGAFSINWKTMQWTQALS